MLVTVYRLRDEGQTAAGAIRWDGKKFHLSGDTKLLRTLLAEPVRGPGGERLTAARQPKAFLQNMYLQYTGAYLRCGRPEATPATRQHEDRGAHGPAAQPNLPRNVLKPSGGGTSGGGDVA